MQQSKQVFQGGGKCHTSDLMLMLSVAGCVTNAGHCGPSQVEVGGGVWRQIHALPPLRLKVHITSNYLLLVSSRETGFSQVMELVSWRLT